MREYSRIFRVRYYELTRLNMSITLSISTIYRSRH